MGAMLALSIPTFWFGLMVIFVFAERLDWIPSGGRETLGAPISLGDRLHHLVAPALVLGLVLVATWSRYTRASMLETIGQDYVRTARAKGLAERSVIAGHALKNALIPLITILGPQIPNLITGTIFVEVIFRVPGLGKFFVSSIYLRDYPMIMATMLLVAALWSATYLLSDVLYTVVDPRVRLFGKRA
jgi:peptide/nickel transport system permease protein